MQKDVCLLGPDRIRISMVEDHSRLYIAFGGPATPVVLRSFREQVVRTYALGHGCTSQAWSLPRSQRADLKRWLHAVAEPEAIKRAGGAR